MTVRFGREILGDLEQAEGREWLVTNGIGGYASGTVAGSLARGYHGVLVAAVHPPTDRRLVLAKFEESIDDGERTYALTTNRWATGAIAPDGFLHMESFELVGSVPVWRYRCGDAVLEKAIWMEHGANTTYVSYSLVSGTRDLRLSVGALVDNRVFHNTGQVAWPVEVVGLDDGIHVAASGPDSPELFVRMANAEVQVAPELFRDFSLPCEASRGLRDRDDHVHAATLSTTLVPGATALIMASTDEAASLSGDPRKRRDSRDTKLRKQWKAARGKKSGSAPDWVEQLVFAADQFIVDRPSVDEPEGKSVIAGYHWFGDWGRDTMISLPGLTLATGRAELAAPILSTFARFVSDGMLPNRFPDAGEQPEYNTVDATLWYFEAIRAYHEATGDDELLERLFPVLEEIVAWHVKGTRYGISIDPTDGLLRWDEAGVQLTWMDAKVGDHVITPRRGKPVEVNALWYNAVRTMSAFAARLGLPSKTFDELGDATLAGFERFWNDDLGYCHDVLDGPDGHESLLRPNQLFAVSLPHSPLNADRQRAVVDVCSRWLLTSHGLASLASTDPAYVGRYGGDQVHRDGSYHQGTVWAWLIGPFVDACLRVYSDTATARRVLEPFRDHLTAGGVGSLSEIFDGDAPHDPRGCIAQAWSVAEVLRAYHRIERTETAE